MKGLTLNKINEILCSLPKVDIENIGSVKHLSVLKPTKETKHLPAFEVEYRIVKLRFKVIEHYGDVDCEYQGIDLEESHQGVHSSNPHWT